MSWPVPLPKWFWPWVRWRRGVAEFAPYGPANHAVRPESAPRKIPTWAWARLKLNIGGGASSPTYTGLCLENGVWLRNPRGGVEDVLEMKTAGYTWIACNLGDGSSPFDWSIVVRRAAAISMHVIPWMRVRKFDDVAYLAHVAKTLWASSAIGLNLEKEAESALPPWACAFELNRVGWTGETITITEPWLYNSTDWKPLAALGPAVLEIFPAEAPAAAYPKACIAHAHEMGFRDVFQCFGTYAGQTPGLYDLEAPHSLYTGDDVGAGNWQLWAA